MPESVDWDALYAEYAAVRSAVRAGTKPAKSFKLPDAAVQRITTPGAKDCQWLTESLKHGDRKWFVANVFGSTKALAEVFFAPMLDAGIDEVNPSFNRSFIEPCMHAQGPRRVNEYLLRVVESGTDFRKAGAVNAMYWAEVGLAWRGDVPSLTIEYATPESRAACEALADVWERKRILLLETFVSNTNVDVRRSIIPSLEVDTALYPESHRPLVGRAIEIARASVDEYIRHRVEVQLGGCTLLGALPHRTKEEGAAE